MKCNELSKFTCDELRYFTWEDLTLGKLELLEKANQNEKIPDEIVEKIYQLCDEVMKEIPSANISLPTDKKNFTIKNLTDFLDLLIAANKITEIFIPESVKKKASSILVNTLKFFNDK